MVVRFDGYFKPSPIDMCATMDFSQKRGGEAVWPRGISYALSTWL